MPNISLSLSEYCSRLPHCTETIPKIRNNNPRKGIARHSPNFHNHVSVSDLYIPAIDQPILLQENMWTDPVKI
jgi:hypothetical protein